MKNSKLLTPFQTFHELSGLKIKTHTKTEKNQS